MNVLVIGSGQGAALIADAVAPHGETPMTRASVATALQTLADIPSALGLILVEPRSDDDWARVPQLIAAASPVPVLAITAAVAQPPDCSGAAPAMCGLDYTADGCQRLRCALLEATQGNEADSPGGVGGATVGFAYNAPCSRRR